MGPGTQFKVCVAFHECVFEWFVCVVVVIVWCDPNPKHIANYIYYSIAHHGGSLSLSLSLFCYLQRVIDEHDPEINNNPDQVKTLVFHTGQIYDELLSERENNRGDRKDVAIVRLEQIAPFAFDRIAENTQKFKNAKVIWALQEPK